MKYISGNNESAILISENICDGAATLMRQINELISKVRQLQMSVKFTWNGNCIIRRRLLSLQIKLWYNLAKSSFIRKLNIQITS